MWTFLINWSSYIGDMLYLWLNETHNQLVSDDVKGIAPGIAFYFIVGFIPFLIFLVNVILYCTMARLDIVVDMFYAYLPGKSAVTLAGDIQRIVSQRSGLWMWMGLLASLASFQQGLAVLVRAVDREHYESTDYEKARKLAFWVHGKALIFSVGLMGAIILSLGMWLFGEAAVQFLSQMFPLPEFFLWMWDWGKYILPFGALIVFLTGFYVLAPRENRPEVLPSMIVSLIVTTAWMAATGIYSWYMLANPSVKEYYGLLIGLFILFGWFGWITYIIIIGNCLLKVWQERTVLWEKYKENGIKVKILLVKKNIRKWHQYWHKKILDWYER